jgi:S1-C subfamily serine protease
MLSLLRTRYAAGLLAILGGLMGGCAMKLREPTREEVLQRVLPAVVQIVIEEHEGRRVRTSSGVVLASRKAPEGDSCFILTAGHAVSGLVGRAQAYVVFGRYRGDGRRVPAAILDYRDTPEIDLALLKTEQVGCVPARVATRPILGESVWAVGYPWGRHMSLASGIVSQINGDDRADPESASRLMVDASVSYGVSGGGVFESRGGALIGLVEGYSTARVSSHGTEPSWYIDVPVPGQTFVTPLSDIKRFLAQSGYPDLIGPAYTGAARGTVLRAH